MRTNIQAANPFGPNRYGFLWETLARHGPGRHLDYGAHDGGVLARLAETGVIAEGIGVDANTAVVERHKGSLPKQVHLLPVAPRSTPLPFPDATFDSASLLDVLEHVVDQHSLLVEVRRVLRPGGLLVVTVPRRYALSFLDTGNWKFRFPRAHRILYSAVRGGDAYRERYVECKDGLFGDIEVGKGMHEHFDPTTLERLLLTAGYVPDATDGAGFFDRVAVLPRLLLPRRAHVSIDRFLRWDGSRFESAHLFMAGRTKPE